MDETSQVIELNRLRDKKNMSRFCRYSNVPYCESFENQALETETLMMNTEMIIF